MNNPDWLKTLKKEGYVVIPDVLSEEKCDHYIDRIWNWLKGLGTGIRRNDPSTHIHHNWPPNVRGIIKWQVGQEDFMWDFRNEESVYNKFTQIWNCKPEDLITSFDGMCIMKPTFNNSHLNPHIDQFYNKHPDFDCVQGLVTLEDMKKESGSFYCIPRTHKLFKKISKDRIEWTISEKQLNELEDDGYKPVYVEAPKGAMVLWDSRLIHCAGIPTEKTRDKFRYVMYACFTERKKASLKTLEKRINAFETIRMSNHCPHDFHLNPAGFRFFDLDCFKQRKTPVKLNSLQRRFVGYEE